MRTSRDLRGAGDLDGAVRELIRTLDRNPRLARAHLDLALLLDQQRADPVRAIYHYERYLELRPETEKSEMIRERIHTSKMLLAASVFPQPPDLARRMEELARENSDLRQQLFEARQAARTQSRPPRVATRQEPPVPPSDRRAEPAAEAPVRPEPPPAPIPSDSPASVSTAGEGTRRTESRASARRTYRVKSGDHLHRIATEMYGDPDLWRRIYDANRDVLRNPNDVRVGQTLVIPQL